MTHFVMASQCVTVRHRLGHPKRFFTFLCTSGTKKIFFGRGGVGGGGGGGGEGGGGRGGGGGYTADSCSHVSMCSAVNVTFSV